MDSEGVAQIVKPWLITSPVMTQHTGADTKADKRVFRCLTRHRSSCAGNQQRCVWLGRVVHRSLGRITGQHPYEIGTHRPESRFVKLAFANREDAAGEIDVAKCEGKR